MGSPLFRAASRLLFLLAAVMATGSSLDAHHSYTNFDIEKTVSIEGEMLELQYVNPHVVLTVRTSTGIYTAVWESPTNIARRGPFSATTLKAGDRVVVVGSPSRSPEARTLARLRAVVRPSDGWHWELPRLP